MRARILLPWLLLICVACTHREIDLSGRVARASDVGPAPSSAPVGIIADSQLQSLPGWAAQNLYRHRLADDIVEVTIRPPALDWTSRHLMLAHLEALRSRGARAIFYLGDGANHGCVDEFSAALDRGAEARAAIPLHEQGVLALLDTFRQRTRIPVFFVLGNHDFLGAGNTSVETPREQLCAHSDATPNRPLSKFEVISLVDRFNRDSEGLSPAWRYRSSFSDPQRTRSLCEAGPSQQRQWGCYLAATVDHLDENRRVQYLLLDTNDYLGVTRSSALGHEFEGLRGAMSFGPARDGVLSQTGWFEINARDHVDARIALTHYDLSALRKHLPVVGAVSSRSQDFVNLFTANDDRRPLQDAAYVVSAHTHSPDLDVSRIPFALDCGPLFCGSADRPAVRELNVGSTTDHPSVSATIRVAPAPGEERSLLVYEEVRMPAERCRAIAEDIESHAFPRAVGTGQVRTGWAALGLNRSEPTNYRGFGSADVDAIWANLASFAGNDPERAVCIGLEAAAIEERQPRPY